MNEAFRDIEVSRGTLREEDLLSSFSSVLSVMEGSPEQLDRAQKLIKESNERIKDGNFDVEACILIEEMDMLLNELSPEGYYFGNLEGDTSCFGFWKIGEEDLFNGEDLSDE